MIYLFPRRSHAGLYLCAGVTIADHVLAFLRMELFRCSWSALRSNQPPCRRRAVRPALYQVISFACCAGAGVPAHGALPHAADGAHLLMERIEFFNRHAAAKLPGLRSYVNFHH